MSLGAKILGSIDNNGFYLVEGYQSGSGTEVYITPEQYQEMLEKMESNNIRGSLDVRGAGSEAKIEAKPEVIEFLKKEFPDLVKGEEITKSNGKISVRLSSDSKISERNTKTEIKINDYLDDEEFDYQGEEYPGDKFEGSEYTDEEEFNAALNTFNDISDYAAGHDVLKDTFDILKGTSKSMNTREFLKFWLGENPEMDPEGKISIDDIASIEFCWDEGRLREPRINANVVLRNGKKGEIWNIPLYYIKRTGNEKGYNDKLGWFGTPWK